MNNNHPRGLLLLGQAFRAIYEYERLLPYIAILSLPYFYMKQNLLLKNVGVDAYIDPLYRSDVGIRPYKLNHLIYIRSF